MAYHVEENCTNKLFAVRREQVCHSFHWPSQPSSQRSIETDAEQAATGTSASQGIPEEASKVLTSSKG